MLWLYGVYVCFAKVKLALLSVKLFVFGLVVVCSVQLYAVVLV